jgi:integrase
MVPAIAVPNDEPRLETLRDRPEISPCRCSGKLDCTRLTEGVSMTPRPSPITSRPGANATTRDEAPLRHAHAVEMAREGVPLNVIQRQLGHANLGITSIYLQGIDNSEIINTIYARPAPMLPASAGLR